jgi:hypothetical protein
MLSSDSDTRKPLGVQSRAIVRQDHTQMQQRHPRTLPPTSGAGAGLSAIAEQSAPVGKSPGCFSVAPTDPALGWLERVCPRVRKTGSVLLLVMYVRVQAALGLDLSSGLPKQRRRPG